MSDRTPPSSPRAGQTVGQPRGGSPSRPDALWNELWDALPEHHDKVEVTLIAYRRRPPFVAIGSGASLAIGHCGQWVSYDGLVGAHSVEEALSEYAAHVREKEATRV